MSKLEAKLAASIKTRRDAAGKSGARKAAPAKASPVKVTVTEVAPTEQGAAVVDAGSRPSEPHSLHQCRVWPD